jgi:hypothetical protein
MSWQLRSAATTRKRSGRRPAPVGVELAALERALELGDELAGRSPVGHGATHGQGAGEPESIALTVAAEVTRADHRQGVAS